MAERGFTSDEWTPAQVGLNAAVLSTTLSSNWIDCKGAAEVVLEIDIDNKAGAAKALTFNIDSQRRTDASDLVRFETAGVDVVAGGVATRTLSRVKYSYTTTAAATVQSLTHIIGGQNPIARVPYERIKLTNVALAGGTTETITVHVRVRF